MLTTTTVYSRPNGRSAEVGSAGGQLTANFHIREFYSRGTPVPRRYHRNVQALARNLQVLRNAVGRSVRIISGYRTPAHNRSVGGAARSQHLVAKAGDVRISGMAPAEVYCLIERLIAEGRMRQGGLGLYRTFVHYDVRGRRARWARRVRRPSCRTARAAPSLRAAPRSDSAPAFDLTRAVGRNRYWMRRLGWQRHFDQIVRLLGFRSMSPGERAFARAVYRWQRQRGLAADGIVGPKTWRAMRRALRSGQPATGGTVAEALKGTYKKALYDLRNLGSHGSKPGVADALRTMKLVCRVAQVPWPLGYAVMAHEGGVRYFSHGDGVMQTTRGTRKRAILQLPRSLKLALLRMASEGRASDAQLNRKLLEAFRRSLAVQIATGVQVLKTNLDKFNGYVALALTAYNAGPGWSYYMVTERSAKRRPRSVSRVTWERMCRVTATRLHQPPSQVRIGEGEWKCDSNIPAWFVRTSVRDRKTGLPLIAYKYLRSIEVCRRARKPSMPCNSSRHKERRPGTGGRRCQITRAGVLDKLFEPKRLARQYRAAVQNEWPRLTDDGFPLKAKQGRLVKTATGG